MDKLISTTDFVIDFLWESRIPLSETYIDSEKVEVIENYTNFLKQKLELWMFVPCDSEGNILEEPDFMSGDYDDNGLGDVDKYQYKKDLEKYEKAKGRCLFQEWDEDDFYNLREYHSDIESIIYQNITLTATAKNKLKYDKLRNQ